MKRTIIMASAAAAALTLFASQPAPAQTLGTGIPLNSENEKTPEQI